MLYDTIPTIVKLTQAQYDALDPDDKLNGTIYFITDGGAPASSAGVIATQVSIQTSSYTAESL